MGTHASAATGRPGRDPFRLGPIQILAAQGVGAPWLTRPEARRLSLRVAVDLRGGRSRPERGRIRLAWFLSCRVEGVPW